ncbi:MAG: sulfur carrier protein ThiS [Chloroflexi bacterium]|nr:sulfur carrier protein ThiS [Chloroflexota bacterium]
MIRVNDKFTVRWRPGMTIRDLLNELKFTFPRLVIAVNGEVIPRDDWETYELQDGDEVKVIHMTAGG